MVTNDTSGECPTGCRRINACYIACRFEIHLLLRLAISAQRASAFFFAALATMLARNVFNRMISWSMASISGVIILYFSISQG